MVALVVHRMAGDRAADTAGGSEEGAASARLPFETGAADLSSGAGSEVATVGWGGAGWVTSPQTARPVERNTSSG